MKIRIVNRDERRLESVYDNICRCIKRGVDGGGFAYGWTEEKAAKARTCANDARMIVRPDPTRALDALASVNGNANAFTLSLGDVRHAATEADDLMYERGVTKKNRTGSVLTYQPAGPTANAYKYAAISTRVELTAASDGGWFLTNVTRDEVYPRTPERREIKISQAAHDDIVRTATKTFYVEG